MRQMNNPVLRESVMKRKITFIEEKTFPARVVDVGSFKFSCSLFNGVLGNSFHAGKLFASPK